MNVRQKKKFIKKGYCKTYYQSRLNTLIDTVCNYADAKGIDRSEIFIHAIMSKSGKKCLKLSVLTNVVPKSVIDKAKSRYGGSGIGCDLYDRPTFNDDCSAEIYVQ